LKCLDAEIQARFLASNDAELERYLLMNIDCNGVYRTGHLAPWREIVFTATGITDSELLGGMELRFCVSEW
jgi:fructose-1,6-bisphosphatase II